MEEPLNLTEVELSALGDLASGKTPAEAAPAGLASLVARGLVTHEGGAIAFGRVLQDAFLPLATQRVTFALLDSGGSVLDQYFLGAEEAAARVLPAADGMRLQRLALAELPAAVAIGLEALLAAPTEPATADSESFTAATRALDMEGLMPLAWGGLVVSRHRDEPGIAPVEGWLIVTRSETGYVWQDPDGGVVAFAADADELANLVTDVLGRS